MTVATPAAEIDKISALTGWPSKRNVFGVGVTPTTYAEATTVILAAARGNESALVSCYSTHSLVEASGNAKLKQAANRFDMITPDGQPVRWALNILHGTRLTDRVYGPELTLWLCRQATRQSVSIYLYGSTATVIQALTLALEKKFPGLIIAGAESPPFRELTAEEDQKTVARINASGAGIVFIGLGCPKQDFFAYEHRDKIRAVQICVGAAFDFHAGTQKMAPAWMQKRGLEWLFRLSQEPRRLWRRYFVTNTIYLLKLAWAWVRR
jgi:N-acetylglucosaminyldiphosphoundecaprenol N-acetyl-beta-D-mannosaminyltransferase